jgi:hypothetical protein
MTHYFVHVAFEKDAPQKVHGPFDSYTEAHAFGAPFAEEGLDVEVRTDDPICDFCSTHEVAWSYPAMDFGVVDPNLGWGSRGDWAACGPCHDFIEDDDRKALAKRSLDLFFEHNPQIPDLPHIRQRVFQHVQLMHAAFFNVRTGPGKKGAHPEIR